MPSLPFVLPHWLYWGTLVVFPIVAMYFVQRQLRRGVPQGPSLFIAYMFWLCSGFMGLHRFYLQEQLGLRLHSGLPSYPSHHGRHSRQA